MLSCALLLVLNIAESGLISIFLVAAPLSDRLVVLLEENRSNIYALQRGSRRANQRAAAGLLWLFVGIAIGYAVVAAWLGERGTLRIFGFAIDAANLHGEDLLHRSRGTARQAPPADCCRRWQAPSLARSINHPPVLIFDEATSSLDTESERAIKQNMDRHLRGRTSFIIAHRMSTVRDADIILVLEKGRIVEQGSHDELMQRQGLYYYLCSEQLSL